MTPVDDWSGLTIKRQRSLEPDVAWHTTGLDTMWDNRITSDPEPETGCTGFFYRLFRS